MCSLHRPICSLTALVCAPKTSASLTAGRARSALPEANVRCTYGLERLQRGVGVPGPRLRMADYVAMPGPTDEATAAGGW